MGGLELPRALVQCVPTELRLAATETSWYVAIMSRPGPADPVTVYTPDSVLRPP